jgi:hypothetical protein
MTDMEPVQILSTPPFSSNDPVTDGLRMLPIDDNPPADDFEVEELTEEEIAAGEAPEPRIPEGAGEAAGQTPANGNGNGEGDAALKAGDWVAEIEAAQDQEALDAILSRYEATGKNFSTVNAAAEARQAALDAENA